MTVQHTTVKLVNAPVALVFKVNQHQQELMREFELIQLSDDRAKREVPARLLEVVDRHRREFSTMSFRRTGTVSDANERGASHIDMEIDVPPTAGPAALELLATFAEADEFCRRGDLLTLAIPAEYVAVREWFLGEIARQLEGHPPTAWRDG
jgi:hypothetical protein